MKIIITELQFNLISESDNEWLKEKFSKKIKVNCVEFYHLFKPRYLF
jgi:hypothetical protein